METSTFDRSPALGLALVAREDCTQARYVPLEEAPDRRGDAGAPYLRQLHCVANTIAAGLIARQHGPLLPQQWIVLSGASGRVPSR